LGVIAFFMCLGQAQGRDASSISACAAWPFFKGGAPTGNQNGNYRHGARTKEAIQAVRYINLLSRLARGS